MKQMQFTWLIIIFETIPSLVPDLLFVIAKIIAFILV